MKQPEVIKILDGLSIEIVVSSEASNNTCCVFIETTPPRGGPPLHKHLREEEVFTVLEGQYEFCDPAGHWTRMETGRPIVSLRNTFHAFRNVGVAPGRMMLMTNHGGIDHYFRAISKLKMPDDAERLNEISEHYGYVYLPPGG